MHFNPAPRSSLRFPAPRTGQSPLIGNLFPALCPGLLVFGVYEGAAQIVVSGFMANPAGTDSPYEYVQLVATESVDFSATPYTVVVANNGIARVQGWAAGGALSHAFQMTSGSVSAGDVFYVGGSGMAVNGSGSASLAGEKWIRSYDTSTTDGDGGTGAAALGGVVGEGGSSADGIAIFLGTSLTSSSVPIDAVFYGNAIGTAYNASTGAGYQVPTTDHMAGGGLFGSAGNSHLLTGLGGGSGSYARLSGTYDTVLSSWTVARTLSVVQGPTDVSSLASGIAVVPEPSGWGLVAGGLLAAGFGLRRFRNRGG